MIYSDLECVFMTLLCIFAGLVVQYIKFSTSAFIPSFI